jgi:hypothetical protein
MGHSPGSQAAAHKHYVLRVWSNCCAIRSKRPDEIAQVN